MAERYQGRTSLPKRGAGRPRAKLKASKPGGQLGDVKLFTIQEVSEATGTSPVTIRIYCSKGKIKARKFGGKWLISEGAIREYFE